MKISEPDLLNFPWNFIFHSLDMAPLDTTYEVYIPEFIRYAEWW